MNEILGNGTKSRPKLSRIKGLAKRVGIPSPAKLKRAERFDGRRARSLAARRESVVSLHYITQNDAGSGGAQIKPKLKALAGRA